MKATYDTRMCKDKISNEMKPDFIVSRRTHFCANGRPEHDHTLPSILFLEDPLTIHPPTTRSIPYVGSN